MLRDNGIFFFFFWELFDMQVMFINCCMGVVDDELKSQLAVYSSSSRQCREVRDFICFVIFHVA